MTTQQYREKSPLRIFLSYFAAHKRLFALDITCAVLMAAIDLSFPLVTRQALYDYLPGGKYRVAVSWCEAPLAPPLGELAARMG